MKYIIPVIVGATIGYITNWLAIKMLFRPYNKKKIFGLTMPFTPGLIPKEKDRIARNVGEAVGQHLLSPSVITDALSNEATNEQVTLWIKDKYYSLKDKNQSLNDLLRVTDRENIDNILDLLSKNLSVFLLDELKNKEFEKKIIEYIEVNMYDEYNNTAISMLKSKGADYLNSIIQSQDTKLILNKIISSKIDEMKIEERNLKSFMPNDTQNLIRDLLEKNKSLIGSGVKEIFNDPSVNERLSKSISEMVNQNLNRVITMFISPDQISEKIMQIVEKYIDDPKSNDDYIMIINNGINKLMENKISESMSIVEPLISEVDVNNISSLLQNTISRVELEEIIKNIEQELYKSENRIKEYLLNAVSKHMNTLINSTSLNIVLEDFIKDNSKEILNRPLSSIFEKVDEDTIKTLISLLKSLFESFAQNELINVIEFFNISKVVEKQINSFDVAYTEELILEIASKELKAITWLGALLGGIMGLLTPLLQML